MEEVDKIIIHSLKDIGCEIDDEIQRLEQFSNELVVEAVGKCLTVIQPELDIPKSLPHNMAARFHVGSTIAQACKDLGYNGDVGYQTFLYSNVVDVRRVFVFLIEKLPREVEKSYIEPDDPVSKLQKDIGKEVRLRLDRKKSVRRSLGIPFISVPLETGIVAPGTKLKGNPKDWRDYVIKDMPFLTEQTTTDHLLPSVISLHSKSLLGNYGVKSTETTPIQPLPLNNFADSVKPVEKEDTWLTVMESLLFAEEEKQEKGIAFFGDETKKVSSGSDEINDDNETVDKELIQEKDPILKAKEHIEELQMKIKENQMIFEKIKEDCKRELSVMEERSKEIEFHEKALSLLPDSTDNLAKLEESIKAMSEKIFSLAARWELFRKPLIDTYIGARSKMANKQSQNEEEHERIKQLNSKIETINKQLVSKRGFISQLEEEYDKLPKNINRSAYTRRIMEIVGNIKKQKDEIEKILKDTKALQKEINNLNGRLERLFAVTEETIFRNAKKDEFSKRVFKLLTTLHSDCSTIVSLVLEIGTITREITELKEQIEIESSKNTTANLERITADLEEMKAESKSLTSQIKKLQSIADVHSHPLL